MTDPEKIESVKKPWIAPSLIVSEVQKTEGGTTTTFVSHELHLGGSTNVTHSS